MLLAIQVSLHYPRFAVLDIKDGKGRVAFTSSEDRYLPAGKRKLISNALMEISDKLAFILAAFPIEHVVWCMYRRDSTRQQEAMTALGAITLVLVEAGLQPQEIPISRIHLTLTGKSKSAVDELRQAVRKHCLTYTEIRSSCFMAIAAGLTAYKMCGTLK